MRERRDVRLHAIVSDIDTARRAVRGGATVIQLRMKGAPTPSVIEHGRAFAGLPAMFVVNDDVEAALALAADGVHLGEDDPGGQEALDRGLRLGISASTREDAMAAERLGAHYIGCGPVWSTPTKADAGAPIGLDGLARVCAAVRIPVIAIGGVDAGNAASCIAAGASGVAVVRAALDAKRVLAAVDRALAQRAMSAPQ
jgi:thiamine-phosphate pyrophosphorylase